MSKCLFLIIIFLICFGFYSSVVAQTPFQEIPLGEEEKTMIGEGIEILKKTLKEVLAIWKQVHQQITKYWKENILPKIQAWYERKKPEIKEQFEKEKEELTKEIKQTFSNFWQWLKDLIK
ncbi:hypothetical protein KJA17_02300 [Patescibacteria group bacterium]|nr:hypothetical protein [Patescibacteria group bacterium]